VNVQRSSDDDWAAGASSAGSGENAAPGHRGGHAVSGGSSPASSPAPSVHFRSPRQSNGTPRDGRRDSVYAALDLGTNNCRLLIARPTRRGFQVIDAFSRIIRLGEGVGSSGRLSETAIVRTIEALKVCAEKMRRRGVERSRLVATEACRIAENGAEFIDRVHRETGLRLEILERESEARLAVCGCASLIDQQSGGALVFDIGGGSSEIIWIDLRAAGTSGSRSSTERGFSERIGAWTSLPVGVVTLSERFGGRHVTVESYRAMVNHAAELMAGFERAHGLADVIRASDAHLLGTSGTVTTVAGIHLALPSYDRSRVDGIWLASHDVRNVSERLVGLSFEERVAVPCIGRDRADLVLAGCAILEAVLSVWPCDRLRVADRGLREGILTTLMAEDGAHRTRRRRGSNGRRRTP
jgi:exopolyphosphatase/guanosine-5'-triphosphate,3'-diphosphate pyrophosphatase